MSLQSKRAALIGAVLGATALAGTVVGVGSIAGAQDSTEPALADDIELSDEIPFYDEFEFDEEFLPEDVFADIEAWQPYEDCIDGQVGDLDDPWVDGDEPSDADWETFDAAWQAADAACRDLLPAEAQAEMEAWDAFDECLSDSGVLDEEFSVGTVVHVESLNGFETIEFGETEGSVTITGTADGVTVTSTGGATVLTEADLDAQWEEFDAAHEACEQLLPEDTFDEFDFEDED